MALLSCPECKKQVSEQASQCPHCGHPVVASKGETNEAAVFLAVAIGPLAIIAVVGILILVVALDVAPTEDEAVMRVVRYVKAIGAVAIGALAIGEGVILWVFFAPQPNPTQRRRAIGWVLGTLLLVVFWVVVWRLKSVVLWTVKFFE